ncbi:MAG: hypothetical protein JW981_10585 [Anaerolineae bacterium]|nr:hypothetical protein [Anaerolineae bacterium]
MKRVGLVILDFILATIAALLGNIVASYYQERFDLTDPTRFFFVAVLFVLCLVASLVVTLKQHRAEASSEQSKVEQKDIQVSQRGKHIKPGGKVEGVVADELLPSTTVGVEQEFGKVSGEMTGVRVGRMGDNSPKGQEKG